MNKVNLLIVLSLLFLQTNIAQADKRIRIASKTAHAKNLSIDDFQETAGIIFEGKFVGSSFKKLAKVDARVLNFLVVDPIRGVKEGTKTLALQEWANVQSKFGKEIKEGKLYVFFFYPKSKLGLTSLLGVDQGAVEVNEANSELSFSPRISMTSKAKKKHQNSFWQDLFSISGTDEETSEEIEITTYQELKEFFNKK